MRTSGRLLMDTAMPDGQIWIPPFAPGSTLPAATNDGTTFKSLIPASGATTYYIPITELLVRLGMSDDAQQQFGQGTPSGGYQGAQGQLTTISTPFTTPYQQSGRPPFLGSQLLSPPINRPKGIAINSISVAYQVLGAATTSMSVALAKTVLTAGVAPVKTLLINATALANAVAAQPQVTVIQNTVQNSFLIDPLAQYYIQLAATTPAGSTVNVFGFYLNLGFNYN